MNSQLIRRFAPVAFAFLSVFAMAGCSVDAQEESASEATGDALTIGASDPNYSGGTFALKPKDSVDACILRKTQDEGWTLNRATAYCECRAKGYSDAHCVYIIPYIDL